MQVSGINPTALSPSASAEKTAGEVQVRLMKKLMDNQKDQMARLMNQLQGVGQQIDVKV
ncbi:MAG: putative motility protein [Fimbriimonadales bacterium]